MQKKVIGIYLAAGKSIRFKQNKLAASVYGRSLGSIALLEALHTTLDHIVIVINQEAPLDWLPISLRHRHVEKLTLTKCKSEKVGQAYSLQHGLQIAQAIDHTAAVLVLLADQPFVRRAQLNMMIEAYRQQEDYTCIGLEHTHISPPLIISPYLFPQLYQLTGDEGARSIIEKYRYDSYFVKVKDPIVFVDIDTQKDWNKWKSLLSP